MGPRGPDKVAGVALLQGDPRGHWRPYLDRRFRSLCSLPWPVYFSLKVLTLTRLTCSSTYFHPHLLGLQEAARGKE